MDVDLDHGAGYGNTLTWNERDKPVGVGRPAEILIDLDKEKFYKMFMGLLRAPIQASAPENPE
jgi:hypothetical protein